VALPEGERDRIGQAGRDYYEAHFAPASLTPALVAHLAQAAQTLRRQ
jgi:hypothetical protein